MEPIAENCSMLHDNRIVRYTVDFSSHVLTMETVTEADQAVTVQFSGLLAHWFENVVQDNILFDLEELSSAQFFTLYQKLLEERLRYGFPICGNVSDLQALMQAQHIRIFVLSASLGLCGFVLAQEIAVL